MSAWDPRIARLESAALTAGDVEAAIEVMHPSVVFDWSRSHSPYQGIDEGRDAVRKLFEDFREAFEEMEYFSEEWIDTGGAGRPGRWRPWQGPRQRRRGGDGRRPGDQALRSSDTIRRARLRRLRTALRCSSGSAPTC